MRTSRIQWLSYFVTMTVFWLVFFRVFDGQIKVLASIGGAAVLVAASATGEYLRDRHRRRGRRAGAHGG